MIVTVTEKTTISNPNYLIYFKGVATSQSLAFIGSDTSDHIERYNKFEVTEAQIENLDEGTYHYYIYAQESNTNLDPTQADEQVENGVLTIMYSDYLTSPQYNTTETYKQYNG